MPYTTKVHVSALNSKLSDGPDKNWPSFREAIMASLNLGQVMSGVCEVQFLSGVCAVQLLSAACAVQFLYGVSAVQFLSGQEEITKPRQEEIAVSYIMLVWRLRGDDGSI